MKRIKVVSAFNNQGGISHECYSKEGLRYEPIINIEDLHSASGFQNPEEHNSEYVTLVRLRIQNIEILNDNSSTCPESPYNLKRVVSKATIH